MTVLEQAREILGTGTVCDACLGRVFAQRSHGLRNEERGRSLRVTLSLVDDEPHETPAALSCWVCEGYTATVDALAAVVVDALQGIEVRTYQVGSRIPPLLEENDRLLRAEAGLDPETGESLKRELNREVGRRVGARLGIEVDFERPDVVCLLEAAAVDPVAVVDGESISQHAVDVQINPAFVYGRYRKLERGIPQTEWPCNECGGAGTQLGEDGEEPCAGCGGSGYRYDDSVEQLVAPHVVEAMEGTEGTFHGAGREDVDAKMLGTGRPFVLEVTRPRVREPDLEAVAEAIHDTAEGRVEVEDLQLGTHEMVERVKELPASKRYRATVTFEEAVEESALAAALERLEGATVEQRTPNRVDHRRADRVRERTVYAIDGELTDEREAVVEIHGEGGLYVKELISSDEGRTEPSLAGELGVASFVEALDVLAVEGEEAPFEDPAYLRENHHD